MSNTNAASDFIRAMVAEDVRRGEHGGRVVTRFPPEPNGYLHIGHAKSICLNFGVAEEFGGRCHLRFDDTNPTTESVEYTRSIERDVRWLGYDWGEHKYHASDYFERLYEHALELVRQGKAYVDHLSEEEIRAYRGTVTEAGRESPHRDRSVAENLDLLARMRAGEFADGTCVLRAKIDMAAANMKMRDPLLYRIRHAHHYRTGDAWCIYPMYDFAHCLSDAIEGITHSLCTLEFENNRDIYDWILEQVLEGPDRPHQTEFARLNLSYTVLSKRKLLRLVEEGHVDGWDDPRMPTLSGYRRRGYTPAAIRAFCDKIGVAKANSTVDVALLEHSIRDDLNPRVPRVLCVLRPLKVVIENYPEGRTEELEAPFYPHDVPGEGSRPLPFAREIYIERDDFLEDPPAGFHRLAPGREVRLRYAYFIRCEKVIKNDAGEVVELRCSYDPATRGGSAPDGRKVRGTLHWVAVAHARPVEVRLYDRLFSVERPDMPPPGKDFTDLLNPDSLEVLGEARIEPAAATAEPGGRFQFERQGYFYLDPRDSRPGRPVFNRVVPLRDTWAKQARQPEPPPPPKREPETTPPPQPREPELTAEEAAEKERLLAAHDLGEQEAEVLARDREAAAFFRDAVARHDNPRAVANWIVHELAGRMEGALGDLPFGPAELAELVALIDGGTITGRIAREEVLPAMLEGVGGPRRVVADRGLEQVADAGELLGAVERVLAEHPAQVAEYRGGKEALLGFFIGRLMAATGGKANPQLARQLLREKLDPR